LIFGKLNIISDYLIENLLIFLSILRCGFILLKCTAYFIDTVNANTISDIIKMNEDNICTFFLFLVIVLLRTMIEDTNNMKVKLNNNI